LLRENALNEIKLALKMMQLIQEENVKQVETIEIKAKGLKKQN
jgi:hypothetical protein